MKTLLQWFDRSSLRSKFYLLGVFCLLAIFLPTGFYWLEARKAIEFSQTEIKGLAPAKAALKLIQRSQQYRGLSTVYLKKMEPPESRNHVPPLVAQKQYEVELALLELGTLIKTAHHENLTSAFDDIELNWRQIKSRGVSSDISWRENYDVQVIFLRKQLDFLQLIVDSYQLSLDPEADGYFLISANLMQLPELTETLGQMRVLGAVYLSTPSRPVEQRNSLSALYALSSERMKAIDTTIEKAQKANAQQRQGIFSNYVNTQEQFKSIAQLVSVQILQPETSQSPPYDPNEYFSAFTLSINSFFSYADQANDKIYEILTHRIANKYRSTFALLSYCLIFFLFAAALVARFVRTLTRQLGGEPSYASQIVKRITQGHLDDPIEAGNSESLLADMQQMQLKLQETDRLKTEFVSTVSHELRTPLTAISGALSISLSGKLGEIPPQSREILSIAHKNSTRLTELINDLLDIDQLIAGQLTTESLPVNLVQVIQEVKESLKNLADKSGVTLASSTSVTQAFVLADERRLRQVLSNLVSNAIKFSPAGEIIYINLNLAEGRARMEVVDQGAGISEEFRARIFQKFSQGDSSDRRAKGGTGLGLAIAKALVSQMGGIIGFQSSLGVGSCFFVEFDLLQNSSAPSHTDSNDNSANM